MTVENLLQEEGGLSRRSFLTGGAVLGGAVALGALAGCSPAAEQTTTSGDDELPATGDSAAADKNIVEAIDHDIVVLGGGWSGLAATVEAAEQGADVVLIERDQMLGGTMSFTEGMFGVNSSLQKQQGVPEYNLNELIFEEQEFAHYLTDYWGYKDFFEMSGENIDWMMAHGTEFGGVDNSNGAGKFDVFHWWKDGSGSQAMQGLADTVEKLGVEVRLGARATELIIDESGRVTGAYVMLDEDGTEYLQVNAKAVIIATGGLSGNLDMVAELLGIDTTYSYTPTGALCTGDGYNMAKQAGAGPASICSLQSAFVYGAGTELSGVAAHHFMIMVNPEGERFMREDLADAVDLNMATNAIAGQGAVHTIIDQANIDKFMTEGTYLPYMFGPEVGTKLENLQSEIDGAIEAEAGSVFKADTLEDLAAQMGVPTDVFLKTIDTYNGYCDAGEDADFGTDPQYLRKVETAPFYAVRQDFQTTKSIGGYKVNRRNEVIDATRKAIPGLYAAGMDGCNMYTDTYNISVPGGNSGYCCYSGRNAAQNAIASL